ncbi:zinc-binding dehydrogenase [Natronorarus salvus]|uniref:zinc-binding dehydrogenase n=1 Tax=Natronorarus salvus TaxID=3117733 RepID=UPI002F26BB1D
MSRRLLRFVGPGEIEIDTEPIPTPDPGEVLVETACSGISPGTELMLFRGEAPTDLPADETIAALSGDLSYPTTYGYACVGRVSEVGGGVAEEWLDRRVFAFQPHASHFTASPDELVPIGDYSPDRATLLPHVETALSICMDARPTIGERAGVFGQGLIGLLTTQMLAAHPLAELSTVDGSEDRRERSLALGADRSVGSEELLSELDCAIELSGNPAALDSAIGATGYGGRVIVGSWYGAKRVDLDLGGRFHRSRISIESSQVSTIAPRLRGRWDTDRRLSIATAWLSRVDPDTFLTHQFSVEEATEAFRLLDRREAVGVVLTY